MAACFAAVLGAQAQDPFTNGLVAYFPFSGNAEDQSGNGNNGTVTAATLALDRFGNTNSAYYFDGVSALITVPDSPSLRIPNDITVTCWLNISQTNLTMAFVGKCGDCGRNYVLSGSTTTPGVWIFAQFPPWGGCVGCQENTGNTVPTIQIGRWYHLVGVRSGSVSRLYVDGTLFQERSPTCAASTYTGDEPLTIGSPGNYDYQSQGASLMQGKLDDIRIYNRALSDTEVQQLYTLEKTTLPYLTIGIKTVRLSLFVKVGTTNQLESSSNMITWTPYGSPFLATNSVAFQDVDVLGGQQFFRINELSP